MIERKIILDKRGIWDEKIVTIILVSLVVVTVMVFLFNADINNFLRNFLPGYSVPEEDVEVEIGGDEESEDLCQVQIGTIGVPEGEIAFGIGAKQYIFIDNEKTDLYWSGDTKEGFIKLTEGDVKLAEIKKGIIFLNSGFFNFDSEFDLDSEEYQKIRFKILDIGVFDFVKIHNSYYAGNNLLCKDEEEDVKIDYGFPDEIVTLKTELLKLEKVSRGFDNGLKISFTPHIFLPEKSHFKFLYILDGGDFLEIKGASFPFDWGELGRIYPDDSVWLDRETLTKDSWGTPGAEISSEVNEEDRGLYYQSYDESNLRVDYEEIKNKF